MDWLISTASAQAAGAPAGGGLGMLLPMVLMIVVFYFLVAHALHLDMTFWDLAVIVPMSFVVQMLPISVNGFGIREATFAFYFSRIGQPLEHALLVSLVPTALIRSPVTATACMRRDRSGRPRCS